MIGDLPGSVLLVGSFPTTEGPPMKLYTIPRPLVVGLLRRGDQLALRPDGQPIARDAEYIDHDLRGKVRWTVVVSDLLPAVAGDPETVKVRHAHGDWVGRLGSHVITREVIELDPWTYVDRTGQPRPE